MYKLFFVTLIAATAAGVLALQWTKRPVGIVGNEADARKVLDEAIKAHGGEVALGKIVGMRIEAKGRGHLGELQARVSVEQYTQGPDKIRTIAFNEDAHFVQVEVINDKIGWWKNADLPIETLERGRLEVFREYEFTNWAITLTPLKGNGFRLIPHGEMSVNGRPAVGILALHDKHNPLELYFDKETHLLVEYQRRVIDPETGKEIQDVQSFSDYRNVQGTMQPFKVQSFTDGEKTFDIVVSDVKLYDQPFDEKVFAKP